MKQNTDLEDCPVRTYGKSELAMKYCPDAEPASAVRTLMRWIKRNKELSTDLNEIGYYPLRRTFLSREVELIFNYLGKP